MCRRSIRRSGRDRTKSPSCTGRSGRLSWAGPVHAAAISSSEAQTVRSAARGSSPQPEPWTKRRVLTRLSSSGCSAIGRPDRERPVCCSMVPGSPGMTTAPSPSTVPRAAQPGSVTDAAAAGEELEQRLELRRRARDRRRRREDCAVAVGVGASERRTRPAAKARRRFIGAPLPGAVDGGGVAAEVGGDDVRVGEHLVRGALADGCAEVHADDAVAELGDERHVVFDDDERRAGGVLELEEQLGEGLALALGDAGGGFVEEEHAGLVGHGAGDLDDAPGAGGELGGEGVAVAVEAHRLDERVDAVVHACSDRCAALRPSAQAMGSRTAMWRSRATAIVSVTVRPGTGGRPGRRAPCRGRPVRRRRRR